MTTDSPEFTKLKAKAFDHLMDVLKGKWKLVGHKRILRQPYPYCYNDEEDVYTDDVPVYEFRIRIDGTPDLRVSLLELVSRQTP